MTFRGFIAGVFLVAMFCVGRPALAETNANLYQEAMQFLAEGHYDQARDALERLVRQEPEHAGAWLDIAILQCSIGAKTEAEALFRAIEDRFFPPQPIREVIAQQRARGCMPGKTRDFARLRLGYGVDNNVNQGASNPNFSIGSGNNLINLVLSPEYAPKADKFAALSAEYIGALSGGRLVGFVQFQSRQYDTLSRYNLNSLVTGVEQPWRVGGWALRGSASLGAITLGGALYQRQGQLQLQLTAPVDLPKGWELGAVGGWTRVAYPSLTGFDSQLWESRGVLTYRNADLYAQAGVGYAYDKGSDQRPGSDRSGVVANLTGRMRLSGEIFGELSWNRQNWEGRQIYSPGLIDVRRQQDSRLLRAAVIVPVTLQHAVHFEFRDVRNRENVSLFEYEGRLLQISWQWQSGL